MFLGRWSATACLLVSVATVSSAQEDIASVRVASAQNAGPHGSNVARIASGDSGGDVEAIAIGDTDAYEVSLLPELAIGQVVWGDQIRLVLNPVSIVETKLQSYEVRVPYTEQLSRTITANVPYQVQEVGADGRKRTVTKYRPEKRTQMVPSQQERIEQRQRQVQVSRIVPGAPLNGEPKEVTLPIDRLSFVTVDGHSLTETQVAKQLKSPSPIVILRGDQTISPLFLKLCKPDTLVLRLH